MMCFRDRLVVLVSLAALGGCAGTPSGAPVGLPSPGASASIPSAAKPAPSATPAALPSTGATAPSSPAPATASTGASGSGPDVGAKTPEERRAAKDRALDASLGGFDAELRKEQARIAREREARSAAKTGGSADSSEAQGQGGEGDLKSDKSGADGKGTKDAHDGDLKSTKQGGSKTGGANGSGKGPSTAPAEAGGGEDDDIVARQLREAAEKETDPELREKLWKEYVEYKKSVKR